MEINNTNLYTHVNINHLYLMTDHAVYHSKFVIHFNITLCECKRTAKGGATIFKVGTSSPAERVKFFLTSMLSLSVGYMRMNIGTMKVLAPLCVAAAIFIGLSDSVNEFFLV